MKSVLKLPQVVSFIWRHPLSRHRRLARLGRFIRWQVGARLVPGPVVVPFVENTRLVVRRGMQGATGNVYTGLHEFDEMAFVLHTLRSSDMFVDVGANVGTYTVLAAGVIGCRCVAVEPAHSTYGELIDNLRLNHVQHLVDAHRVAAGDREGSICMTTGLGPMNRVVCTNNGSSTVANVVTLRRLDDLLAGKPATIIKIDVEGFEPQVIAGALRTLRQSSVLAVLMEANRRVGRDADRQSVSAQMADLGYRPFRYHGITRRLEPADCSDRKLANVMFIRSEAAVLERIRSARRFRVMDAEI